MEILHICQFLGRPMTIILFIAVVGLVIWVTVLNKRIHKLEGKAAKLKERVDKLEKVIAFQNRQIIKLGHQTAYSETKIRVLEDCNNKRLNHKTAAAIEDAIAVLLDVQREEDYLSCRRKQLHEIMKMARTNPSSYDEDRPNGKVCRD